MKVQNIKVFFFQSFSNGWQIKINAEIRPAAAKIERIRSAQENDVWIVVFLAISSGDNYSYLNASFFKFLVQSQNMPSNTARLTKRMEGN